LAHHLIGQAAPNSPLVHILADRLALRLLDAGRGEEAASLVRDLSPAHDFGQALTQRGAELLRRGQYARAAWVYRTMIVTRVDLSGESYERLAECYRGLGRRDDEAETIARALIALLPEQPVSQRVFPRLLELEAGAADAERLGRVYAAWLAAGRQDYEDARLLLREVLRAQLKAGRAARLAALLDDPRIAPASRDMLGELADEAGRRQDWDAALLARRRLVARSPDDLQATRGLIEALKQTGRFAEEAEAIARALQQLPPQSVDAARLLQRLFALEAGGLAAGEYEAAARQTLGDARRSPAARAAAFKRLLRLLLDRGRDNEANALLAGAAEEWDPDGALETLAADYLAGGRCDLATRVAQKGLARNPLDESAFRRVLQCLPRAGEAGAQALAPLEQALAVDSAAYRSRVDELYRAGSSGPFEEWAQRLLAATPPQDPGRLDVVEKLLAVYAASGRPGEALALAARETGLRNASAAPALLWAMADFAYVQRLPGVDDALLAQAERGEELGESCRRVATARRALIAQSPTSPRFAMRNAAVRPGSLASWRAWAGVNFGRGRADAATRALVNATAPWSDDFQTCHDAVAIARARGLSIDGQTAEALAALREVCCDPDMKTIARGMEASWRAAGSGGKDK
jgi:lipopolysaccharide biosynthesis regulator YciM